MTTGSHRTRMGIIVLPALLAGLFSSPVRPVFAVRMGTPTFWRG